MSEGGTGRGIDGELFVRDSPNGSMRRIVLRVECGELQRSHVRELLGVVRREDAALGVLLSLRRPTAAMELEAVKAGFFESHLGRRRKIQIVTAEQALHGKGIDAPGMPIAGLKKARMAPLPREPATVRGKLG
jgi:hypothetical protein